MTARAIDPAHRSPFACARMLARFEWIKQRSLRSTWIAALIALVPIVGFGADTVHATTRSWPHQSPTTRASFQPIYDLTRGFNVAQIAIGLLAIVTVTSEFATGTIRPTLVAVPKRVHLLTAKAAVCAASFFVIAELGVLINLAMLTAVLPHRAGGPTLASSADVRATIGAGLVLALIGLFALGLGAAIRNTAGAIGVFVGLLYVAPRIIPEQYLPTGAGSQLLHTAGHPSLPPWIGLAILIGWSAAALAAGVRVICALDL